MATTIAELNVKITSDMAKINQDLAQLKAKVQGADKPVENLGAGFSKLGILAGVGIGAAIAGFARLASAGIKAAATYEKQAVAFSVMLGSAGKATAMLKDIQEFAAATPLQGAALQQNALLLLNFGAAAEEIMPTLRMLGDVSGGDQQKLDSLTLAFAQMSSAGRLMGQDLLQMINAGFNPLQIMSEKTGKSMGQLKKEMEQGAISSEMVKAAFKDATSEGGRFYQMLEKQSQTLSGMWSTFQDLGDIAVRTFGEELAPVMKLFLQDLIDSGDETIGLAQALGQFTAKAILAFRIAYQQLALWGAQIQVVKFQVLSSVSEMASKIYSIFGSKKLAAGAMEGAIEAKKAAITYQLAVGQIEGDLAKTKKVYNAIGVEDTKKAENERVNAVKKATTEIKAAHAQAAEALKFTLNDGLQTATSTIGNISSLWQEYNSNRMAALDYEQQQAQEKIAAQYEVEKANIESTIVDKKERDAALKALDEKRARDEKKLNEKIEKEKRKVAHDAAKIQRGIDLAQAVSNTALGISNIWVQWGKLPMVAGALTAIFGAVQAAQIALIATRPLPPLAKGGYFEGPAIIGEAGREMALPLEGDNGRAAMREMADAILDQIASRADRSPTIDRASSSGGGGGNVYLDGALVGKWISDTSVNGGFQINQRVIVS
jgi:tape measure domain-containing protein